MTYYDSTIYFISYNGHDWSYTSNYDMTHVRSCSICDDIILSSCDMLYTYAGSERHTGECNECDYTSALSPCSYEYVSNSVNTHIKACAVCNNSTVQNCDFASNYAGSGAHISMCDLCDYYFFESCTRVPTYCGDDTLGDVHTSACVICDYTAGTTTACTFVYEFAGRVNGVYTHNRLCEDCGYVKAQNVNCLYKNGETCAFCGHEKPLTGVVSTPPTTVTE